MSALPLAASVSSTATASPQLRLARAALTSRVNGRVQASAAATVERHRSLVMFVTVGLAVDSSLEAPLEAVLGTDTRRISEPESARGRQPVNFG